MDTTDELQEYLDSATIAEEVFELRPDYRALLIAVSGIVPPSSPDADADATAAVAAVDALIQRAEAVAQEQLAATPVDQLPHIAAWREAYQSFGAKPSRTRNSLEALMRRAATELPRVNRLTDIYNSISVIHQIPLGGEDLAKYVGSPQLKRSHGAEPFDTVADGETVIENPEIGEVIWCDDYGVTCRRWNWRQGRRTGLTDDTTSALFILDALAPITDEHLTDAAVELIQQVVTLGPAVQSAQRLIAKPS